MQPLVTVGPQQRGHLHIKRIIAISKQIITDCSSHQRWNYQMYQKEEGSNLSIQSMAKVHPSNGPAVVGRTRSCRQKPKVPPLIQLFTLLGNHGCPFMPLSIIGTVTMLYAKHEKTIEQIMALIHRRQLQHCCTVASLDTCTLLLNTHHTKQ